MQCDNMGFLSLTSRRIIVRAQLSFHYPILQCNALVIQVRHPHWIAHCISEKVIMPIAAFTLDSQSQSCIYAHI